MKRPSFYLPDVSTSYYLSGDTSPALDNDLDKPRHASVIRKRHFTGQKCCTHEAETDIGVAIARIVVVAISRPQVLGIVVPTAAACAAGRASKNGRYAKFKDLEKIFLLS